MKDTVQDYLEDQGGITTMSAAIKATSRQKVELALESNNVFRQGRSTLFLPTVDPRLVAAFVHGGCLTCVSALDLMGVKLWVPPTRVHLAVSEGYHRRHSGKVVLHREKWINFYRRDLRLPLAATCSGDVPGGDFYSTRARVASALNATIRALQCVESNLERVVIADSVLNKRLVTREELERAASHLRRASIKTAIAKSDGAARSPLETVCRLQLRKTFGPEVKTGVVLEGIGEVDFLIGRLIVEIDGYEFHCGRTEFDKDRSRSRAALLRGYATMRFTYDDVMSGRFLDQIGHYLEQGPA